MRAIDRGGSTLPQEESRPVLTPLHPVSTFWSPFEPGRADRGPLTQRGPRRERATCEVHPAPDCDGRGARRFGGLLQPPVGTDRARPAPVGDRVGAPRGRAGPPAPRAAGD